MLIKKPDFHELFKRNLIFIFFLNYLYHKINNSKIRIFSYKLAFNYEKRRNFNVFKYSKEHLSGKSLRTIQRGE